MTLTELATAYVVCRVSLIEEFSGNFDRSFGELEAEVRTKIDPLLRAHGLPPLDTDDLIPRSDEDADEAALEALDDMLLEDCKAGLHSWADTPGILPPDAVCTDCGELYGEPK